MKKTGKILISAELAREYGFKDTGGLNLSLFSNSANFLFSICFKFMKNFKVLPLQSISLGIQPISIRQVKFLFHRYYPSVEWMIPEFLYFPWWMVAMGTHKFW